ncbi:hypothetical protein AMECASPLE_030543 [Ameca splendens]|uniref:Uncharacterized protein n=1 Tax=Ameca splendens TaxID=208324 RepID=A0ABV0XJ43_9TELE
MTTQTCFLTNSDSVSLYTHQCYTLTETVLWRERAHLHCHTCGASHIPVGKAPFFAKPPVKQPLHHNYKQDHVAAEIFLKKLTPPSKHSQATSLISMPLLYVDRGTYDSSRLDLSFSICHGQSSQCTQRSSTQSEHHRKGKGQSEVGFCHA